MSSCTQRVNTNKIIISSSQTVHYFILNAVIKSQLSVDFITAVQYERGRKDDGKVVGR
jgi:hypothetical protein